MRSHMHELWEDLGLSPLYPEPNLDRVADRVMEQIQAEEPETHQTRRKPMHKKKLLLSLAAALVVLTGSAVAVGSRLGLLGLFFQGDTSGLESYVRTEVGSAEPSRGNSVSPKRMDSTSVTSVNFTSVNSTWKAKWLRFQS